MIIYDPTDPTICMNSCGVLFYLHEPDDGTRPIWREVRAGVLDPGQDFTRPEW